MTHQQPHLSEQELLADLLYQEKSMMSNYAASIQEASCRNLRKLLMGQFNQTCQDQFELLDQMREKGYLKLQDATAQQVQQVKNAFKNTQP